MKYSLCFTSYERQGWSGGANELGRGVLLIWIIVGQGHIERVVGAGGGCLGIFSLVVLFSFLSSSQGDDPILTEILSQRSVKP